MIVILLAKNVPTTLKSTVPLVLSPYTIIKTSAYHHALTLFTKVIYLYFYTFILILK